MNAQDIVNELKTLGSESTKRVLMKHGAKEPFFGVKIEHLKKIQKRVKVDYQLALDLYDTGISDAMYLAGLIADDAKMTKKDLQKWLDKAYWHMLSEYTVPWVAAGSPHGHDLALKWIDSKKESVAAAGWCTLAGLVSTTDDEDLDLGELKGLLDRVEKTIHKQAGRVKYTMNGFVIALAGYVAPLTKAASAAAKRIGKVTVDMGDTECRVPHAPDYIKKMLARGVKKRKTVKC